MIVHVWMKICRFTSSTFRAEEVLLVTVSQIAIARKMEDLVGVARILPSFNDLNLCKEFKDIPNSVIRAKLNKDIAMETSLGTGQVTSLATGEVLGLEPEVI